MTALEDRGLACCSLVGAYHSRVTGAAVAADSGPGGKRRCVCRGRGEAGTKRVGAADETGEADRDRRPLRSSNGGTRGSRVRREPSAGCGATMRWTRTRG